MENFTLAVSLFTQVIASDPHVALHYTGRGIAYAQSKKYACAIGDFQTASSKADYIPSPTVSLWTAKCRFYLGSHASALLAVRDVLSLDPDHTDALALKRRLVELQKHIEDYHTARKRQHWKLARAAYESCLGIYSHEDCELPVDIRCWNVELRMAEADWESVASSVERLMHKEPKSTDVMLLRARVLLLTAKLTDALTQTMAVLKLDPDDANAKEIRTRLKGIIRSQSEGGVHFRHGRWIDAIREWDEALRLVGDKDEEGKGGIIRATLLRSKAEAELNLGNYSDCIKYANLALELDATYAEAFLTRARVNVVLELYDVAVEDFRAALQLGKLTMPALVLSSVEEELNAAEQKAIGERRDINLEILRVEGYRKFCNKIYNATKFAMLKLDEQFVPEPTAKPTGNESIVERWILHKLNVAARDVNQQLEQRNFMAATNTTYNFWLYELCDVYIEAMKVMTDESASPTMRRSAQQTLYTSLDLGLRLLHPFMPFVTEELWQRLPRRPNDSTQSIMLSAYPVFNSSSVFEDAYRDFELVFSAIKTGRSLAASYNLQSDLQLFVRVQSENEVALFESQVPTILALTKHGKSVKVVRTPEDIPAGCGSAVLTPTVVLHVLVRGQVDLDAEIVKCQKKLDFARLNLDKILKTESQPDYENVVAANVRLFNEEKRRTLEADIANLELSIQMFEKLK
ncbi:hypothetical protein IEO21_07030 [Rhodonia placenta]|uniref:valine--tRNA ligase n=1 Tax=Rhodonia placenta TaxID=104341 RepID=A0A8H7U060_9APHY|nr:hypothetical protein IEO21_07030 [Postia placenta]